MSDLNDRVKALSALMDEFGLDRAEWKGEDWAVELGRHPSGEAVAAPILMAAPVAADGVAKPKTPRAKKPKVEETGVPVTSPMTGIYYGSPSPGAAAFVSVGQTVQAGEVVGLIEAMKVFNEITAPVSGVVSAVKVENGQLVQPGDVLVRIG
ncbi:MAG: biotin/lipoyl-binding protein [Fimbriimonadaceae bacterium]|nr:biotin/lipoyl-binding protein [Fimbriimonadaceae bacterium]